jgi:hypothetical protein
LIFRSPAYDPSHGPIETAPRPALPPGSYLVVGLGRAGLAAARALAGSAADGANYPALEADGFSGAATGDVVDAERMRADFAAYRPELGTLGFDLVRNHHSASKHAEALLRDAAVVSRVAAEERLNLALGSRSWRLMAPLRQLGGAVRRRGRRSF